MLIQLFLILRSIFQLNPQLSWSKTPVLISITSQNHQIFKLMISLSWSVRLTRWILCSVAETFSCNECPWSELFLIFKSKERKTDNNWNLGKIPQNAHIDSDWKSKMVINRYLDCKSIHSNLVKWSLSSWIIKTSFNTLNALLIWCQNKR